MPSRALKNSLLLAEDRCKSTDLCAKRSSDVLGAIRHQILYCGHNVVEKRRSVEQAAKA